MKNISLMIRVKVIHIQSMDTFSIYQNWILNYKLRRKILYVKRKKMIYLLLFVIIFSILLTVRPIFYDEMRSRHPIYT